MDLMRRIYNGESLSDEEDIEKEVKVNDEEKKTKKKKGKKETKTETEVLEIDLSLTHLKKLYEYYVKGNETKDREEERIYAMLPLFIKVFSSSSGNLKDFSEFLSFSRLVTKLFVSEIRRRASDISTEAAALSISKYMEIQVSEESSNGWMLLSTLNILSSESDIVSSVFLSSSLPSTLVKCLYIFFDLPDYETASTSSQNDFEFTSKEKRILLQKMFLQILLRLTSQESIVEELARKDDLTLLFSSLTTPCASHNIFWRKTSSEILLHIFRTSLSQPVISYLHNKRNIFILLEDLSRVSKEIKFTDLLDVFITILSLLKDSSERTTRILEDFKEAHGYIFIINKFLFKWENLSEEERRESKTSLGNLIQSIVSLCYCETEINSFNSSLSSLTTKAQNSTSLYVLSSFTRPEVKNKDYLVSNVNAFNVLQTGFMKSVTSDLGTLLLSAISSIYTAEDANYFLLEDQATLSQFAETISGKDTIVQEHYFKIIEFVIFHLKFVPCKEFIALSRLLKANLNDSCSSLLLNSLTTIIKFDPLFKDVFREVGILEVVCELLQRYLVSLEDSTNEKSYSELRKPLFAILTELLSTTTTSIKNPNASVFREIDAHITLLSLVKFDESRDLALKVFQILILSNGVEDDMSPLCKLLVSLPKNQVECKISLLSALSLSCKESHRVRVAFRRIGGFTYLLSCLKDYKGSLGLSSHKDQRLFLSLFHSIFDVFTLALRYEPANAYYFENEIITNSYLLDALLDLGCFSKETTLQNYNESDINESLKRTFFEGHSLSEPLQSCYLLIQILWETAIESSSTETRKYFQRLPSSELKSSVVSSNDSKGPLLLNLRSFSQPSVIIHPSLILLILRLLPRLYHSEIKEESFSLQSFVLENHLKSLLRTEKNQQIMSELDFLSEILTICQRAFENESHGLHASVLYLFERLSAQKIKPSDLRVFLRYSSESSFLPLSTLKSLVSMTTPKNSTSGNDSIIPPFVEFDMRYEGFACLYLPSLAPNSLSTSSISNERNGGDAPVLGGIGTGARTFPPISGFSFSTWICVDQFSDPRQDPHPLRLLTLLRSSFIKDSEEESIVLSISLSSRDRAFIVSTQNVPAKTQGNDRFESYLSGDSGIRIAFPDLIRETQWTHLLFVLSRSKKPSFSLYVNGQHISTHKMKYISSLSSSSLPSPSSSSSSGNIPGIQSIFGFIGTPPLWRRQSRLCWKQGPCLAFEEASSAHLAFLLFKLGPHYLGSLQAPSLHQSFKEVVVPMSQVSEEKLLFGLNAVSMTEMTLCKIKKVYSRIDTKYIAKTLGMSSNENATPIRVLHNSCSHLLGPARSLGGILIGYVGVRAFCPIPLSKVINTIGGSSVLLSILSSAQNVECFIAAVKALVCVLQSNPFAVYEMELSKGYQILAMLFGKKKSLLNVHVLHLMFSLAGTHSERESSLNFSAFRDVVCDLELWTEAHLERNLMEHLYELIIRQTASSIKTLNEELHLVHKLLSILRKIKNDSDLSSTTSTLLNSLHALLSTSPRQTDLLSFALFTLTTLEDDDTDLGAFGLEGTELRLTASTNEKNEEKKKDNFHDSNNSQLLLRNRCLKLFFSLLYHSGSKIHVKACEDVIQVLGFDWILIFLNTRLHSSTHIWALRILTTLLSIPHLLSKFRAGTCNGHWFLKSNLVLQNNFGMALGTCKNSDLQGTDKIYFSLPGFQVFHWQISTLVNIQLEGLYVLLALVFGVSVKDLPHDTSLSLTSIRTYIFGSDTLPSSLKLVDEALITLFLLVRQMLFQRLYFDTEYPEALLTFIVYMYHNVSGSKSSFYSEDVLKAIVASLFPYQETLTEENNKEEYEEIFINSPVKRMILNFIKMMTVDSLSCQATPKNPPVIDILLDAKPISSSDELHWRFQSKLLEILMDHLVAADVLSGNHTSSGSDNNNNIWIVPNVFYVASRLVDKMWQGIFKKDPNEIFEFILKLIDQVKRRGGGNSLSLEGIYRSLNRTILYMMSRSLTSHSLASLVSYFLEILHRITSNRNLIFGAGNHELEFFGSLTFCLLAITANLTIPLECESKTTWHVPRREIIDNEEEMDFIQGQNLLSQASSRVWDELYVSKKPALEEVFKTSFGAQNSTPALETLRTQINESASKIWFTYLKHEKGEIYHKTPPWEFHTQLQSKLQRVTGGLTGSLRRLTSVTGSSNHSSKKDEDSIRNEKSVKNLTLKDYEETLRAQLESVRSIVEEMFKNRRETETYLLKYTQEKWRVTESRLSGERGLWGPTQESPLTKWMIDMTEGPFRMRSKLIRNDFFFLNYPFYEIDETVDSSNGKYKKPLCFDSRLWYEEKHLAGLSELESSETFKSLYPFPLGIDEQMKEMMGIRGRVKDSKPFSSRSSEDENEENTKNEEEEIASTEISSEMNSDYQTVMRLLETGEKISHLYRCSRIQGLESVEGLLLFGKDHCYVLDGFTLTNERDVHDIETLSDYEPIIPNIPGQISSQQVRPQREVLKVLYDNIREVTKRRYLLQPIALEVFSLNGQNVLLSFTKSTRLKVYHRFLAAASSSLSNSASHSVSGQRSSANVEPGSGLFSSLIGETSVTQRWIRGEINNFTYLMALNTLAGRSYNDLMQYPIFPWILSDYKSEELNLEDSQTFRDLSKPMGAQNLSRLEQFKRRYEEWEILENETPPYHYGTHYSSAMIVSSYLVRVEPFTQHFLHLQGGHFDLADRMFHSLEEAWDSASKNNMADVRELIPEFFYLSDLFTNVNHFDLGTKQNGERLNDVILPPWAKGSPVEFVRAHREALESDYVSSHLHEWIDLIFGYKQSGQAAIDSHNVFHHLFYEGNVDVFSIDDPLQRNAAIGFINNFGQIPKNLFKKPHPCKKDPFPKQSKVFFHHLNNLRPSMSPMKEVKGPVGQIVPGERSVYIVETNKVLVPGNLNRYLSWGYNDQSFRLCHYETDKAIFICEPNYLIGSVLACVMPNAKTVITAGTLSVIAVYEYDKKNKQLHIRKLLYGHSDAVTCLSVSSNWNIGVSGSRDKSAILWDLSRYIYVRHLPDHAGPVAAVSINELTGNIVTASGSWLYVWDINGRLQACVNTESKARSQILCVASSQFQEWNRENVILSGSTDGVVRMWSLDLVEVKENTGSYRWENTLVFRGKLTMHTAVERPDNTSPAAVTALAISKDHRVVYVGDERGRVFSWSVSSKPGKGMVDHWWQDEDVESCFDCEVKFTIYERKHHCRNCGKVFCNSCTSSTAQIPSLNILQYVRVCKACWSTLQT